jgi:hypothetical protein
MFMRVPHVTRAHAPVGAIWDAEKRQAFFFEKRSKKLLSVGSRAS